MPATFHGRFTDWTLRIEGAGRPRPRPRSQPQAARGGEIPVNSITRLAGSGTVLTDTVPTKTSVFAVPLGSTIVVVLDRV